MYNLSKRIGLDVLRKLSSLPKSASFHVFVPNTTVEFPAISLTQPIHRSYGSIAKDFFSDSVPASVRAKLQEARETTAWVRENAPWAPHEQYLSTRVNFVDEATLKESSNLKVGKIIVLGQYHFPLRTQRAYGTTLFRMAVPDIVVKSLVSRLEGHVKLNKAPLLRSSSIKRHGTIYHMTTVYMDEDYIKLQAKGPLEEEISYPSFRARLVSENPEDIHASGELKVFLKYGGTAIKQGEEVVWQIGLVPKRLRLGEAVEGKGMDPVWDCLREHTA